MGPLCLLTCHRVNSIHYIEGVDDAVNPDASPRASEAVVSVSADHSWCGHRSASSYK